ncbi:schizont egress antigen-1, putative [Plasmodium chabaudi chabaudi]|uniref:Schizont egress antigen-1, putative n=1 Tax=Plasmodium chabaudi chabaudi TaxID=31271 RepID=A0A4V0K3D5_PLACU|nr:schizont egress antigen-1, putative [Plasmodium chabaudi chabaudi]VTZ67398.1 schizont egress antigen-1, putative [Plasmodium chabaudi chabaudi]|eukprot:XP_016655160.1 centromere protein C, putative [Plasmodium chabaudi chabaudi]
MTDNEHPNKDDLLYYINRYDVNDILGNLEENDKLTNYDGNSGICEYEIPFLLENADINNNTKEHSDRNSVSSYFDDGTCSIISKNDEKHYIDKCEKEKIPKEKINIIFIQNKGEMNSFEDILSMSNVSSEDLENKLNDRFYQLCCKSIADVNTHNLNKTKNIVKDKKGSLNIEHIDYGDVFLTIRHRLRGREGRTSNMLNDKNNLYSSMNDSVISNWREMKNQENFIKYENYRGHEKEFIRRKLKNTYMNNLNGDKYFTPTRKARDYYRTSLDSYMTNENERDISKQENMSPHFLPKKRKSTNNSSLYNSQIIGQDEYILKNRTFLKNFYIQKNYKQEAHMHNDDYYCDDTHSENLYNDDVYNYNKNFSDRQGSVPNNDFIYSSEISNKKNSIPHNIYVDKKLSTPRNSTWHNENQPHEEDMLYYHSQSKGKSPHYREPENEVQSNNYCEDKNSNIFNEDVIGIDKVDENDNMVDKVEEDDNTNKEIFYDTYDGDERDNNETFDTKLEEDDDYKTYNNELEVEAENGIDNHIPSNNNDNFVNSSKNADLDNINTCEHASHSNHTEKEEEDNGQRTSSMTSKDDKDYFELLIKKYEETRMSVNESGTASLSGSIYLSKDEPKEPSLNAQEMLKTASDAKNDVNNKIDGLNENLIDLKNNKETTNEGGSFSNALSTENNNIGKLESVHNNGETERERGDDGNENANTDLKESDGYEKLLKNDMYDLYNIKMHDLNNLKSYDFEFSKNLLKNEIFSCGDNINNDEINLNDNNINEKIDSLMNNYNMMKSKRDKFNEEENEIQNFLAELKADVTNQLNLNNVEDGQAFDLLNSFDINNNDDDFGDNFDDIGQNKSDIDNNKEFEHDNDINHDYNDYGAYMDDMYNNNDGDNTSRNGSRLKLSDLNDEKNLFQDDNSSFNTPIKSSELKRDSECQTNSPLIFSRSNRTPRKKSVEVILVKKKLKKRKEKESNIAFENTTHDDYTVGTTTATSSINSKRRYPKRNRIKTLRYWIGERELTKRNPETGEIDVVGFSECKNLEQLSPHIIGPVYYKKMYLRDVNNSNERGNEDDNNNLDQNDDDENEITIEVNNGMYENEVYNKIQSNENSMSKNDNGGTRLKRSMNANTHNRSDNDTTNRKGKRKRKKFINVINYIKKKTKKKLVKVIDKEVEQENVDNHNTFPINDNIINDETNADQNSQNNLDQNVFVTGNDFIENDDNVFFDAVSLGDNAHVNDIPEQSEELIEAPVVDAVDTTKVSANDADDVENEKEVNLEKETTLENETTLEKESTLENETALEKKKDVHVKKKLLDKKKKKKKKNKEKNKEKEIDEMYKQLSFMNFSSFYSKGNGDNSKMENSKKTSTKNKKKNKKKNMKNKEMKHSDDDADNEIGDLHKESNDKIEDESIVGGELEVATKTAEDKTEKDEELAILNSYTSEHNDDITNTNDPKNSKDVNSELHENEDEEASDLQTSTRSKKKKKIKNSIHDTNELNQKRRKTNENNSEERISINENDEIKNLDGDKKVNEEEDKYMAKVEKETTTKPNKNMIDEVKKSEKKKETNENDNNSTVCLVTQDKENNTNGKGFIIDKLKSYFNIKDLININKPKTNNVILNGFGNKQIINSTPVRLSLSYPSSVKLSVDDGCSQTGNAQFPLIQQSSLNNFKLDINLFCVQIPPSKAHSSNSYDKILVGYIYQGKKIKIYFKNQEKYFEKDEFFYIPKFSPFKIVNISREDCILYVYPISK